MMRDSILRIDSFACTAYRYCLVLHHWSEKQPPGCRSEPKRVCKPWFYAKILRRSTLPKKRRADTHIERTVNNQEDHLGCREKFLAILKNRFCLNLYTGSLKINAMYKTSWYDTISARSFAFIFIYSINLRYFLNNFLTQNDIWQNEEIYG